MTKPSRHRAHRAGFAFLLVLCIASALALPAVATPAQFPKPQALNAQVEFWKRVYTEIDTGQGFLHDAEDLSIVYETISVPKNLGRRARERHINRYRKVIEDDLALMGLGRRSRLTRAQKRTLRLFPPKVSNRRLARAARQVRFQTGQADKFLAGLKRQGRWQAYMREVFERRGLPVELAALPHVESSFNPKATSSVGASGLWQFTRSTGRRYLAINAALDERNDPWQATDAAARLLADNYRQTKSWPLAITAYNHGVGGMRRAIRRLGTRDIATVLRRYKSRTFGFASRNFYCSFLAALEIDREPERYFGSFERDLPQNPERIRLRNYYRPASLARVFNVSIAELRTANPALRRAVWSGHKYVPRNYELQVPRSLGREPAAVLLTRVPRGERHTQQIADTRYRVRPGDTTSQIARRFRVSQHELVVLNGLRSPHRIRAGQVLTLPPRARSVRSRVTRQPIPASGEHHVARGETLASVAKRFGLRVRDLTKWNQLKNPNLLHPGQKLALHAPGSAPAATTAAARVYTVRRGDTIHGIAKRLGVRPEKILAYNANTIRNRHRIYPGDELQIPRE